MIEEREKPFIHRTSTLAQMYQQPYRTALHVTLSPLDIFCNNINKLTNKTSQLNSITTSPNITRPQYFSPNITTQMNEIIGHIFNKNHQQFSQPCVFSQVTSQ
ncbi:hypothetical protein HanRHA438_Chr06g0261431 [Helianthus annuus]|nr:hypothetical protein HanRHA438_Chr06g0261431 [Helianthus annuus]